jgi:hypothetical protein
MKNYRDTIEYDNGRRACIMAEITENPYNQRTENASWQFWNAGYAYALAEYHAKRAEQYEPKGKANV